MITYITTLFYRRPETSFFWLASPWKSFKHIIWRNYKWWIIGFIVLVLVLLLLFLFIYSLPVSITKKTFYPLSCIYSCRLRLDLRCNETLSLWSLLSLECNVWTIIKKNANLNKIEIEIFIYIVLYLYVQVVKNFVLIWY